jgi:Ca2+-binding RTX toxin-like protein
MATLIGTPDGDPLTGSDGADSLAGLGGADRLTGRGGLDTLDGGAEADTLDGASAAYGYADDPAAGRDVLRGGDGNDRIFLSSDDSVSGGAGDDLFDQGLFFATSLSGRPLVYGRTIGGTGIIDGGSGTDTLNLLQSGRDLLRADLSGWTIAGVERLQASTVALTAAQLSAFAVIDAVNPFPLELVNGEPANFFTLNRSINLEIVGGGRVDFTGRLGTRVQALQIENTAAAEVIRLGATSTVTLSFLDGQPDDTAADSVIGGAGNDYLDGGGGADTMVGGAGADLIIGTSGNREPMAPGDADRLDGGAGNDTISRPGNGDSVYGRAGADLIDISGLPLEGPAGPRVIDGGDDADTLRIDHGDISRTIIASVERLEVANVTLTPTQLGRFAEITSIPSVFYGPVVNLRLAASGVVDLTGRLAPTLTGVNIVGHAGGDTVTAGEGFAGAVQFLASLNPADAGRDQVRGGAGNDALHGWAGADTLVGLGGTDFLTGGADDDMLQGGAGDDTLYGEDGADSLSGGEGADTLGIAGAGDSILGGAGADLIFEERGAPVTPLFLDGGEGMDTLRGAFIDLSTTTILGVERLEAATLTLTPGVVAAIAAIAPAPGWTSVSLTLATPGSYSLVGKLPAGAIGTLTVQGSAGSDNLRLPSSWTGALSFFDSGGPTSRDTVTGGAGNDWITTGQGNDLVNAGGGADQLRGGEGNDRLNGDGGQDSIVGEDGADTLSGGDGNDTIEIAGTGDSVQGGAGDDLVTNELFRAAAPRAIDGGTGMDTLQLSGVDLSATVLSGIERLEALGVTITVAQLDGIARLAGLAAYGGQASITLATSGIADLRGKVVAETTSLAVTGSAGADELYLDRLWGGTLSFNDPSGTTGSHDRVFGGAGNDLLSGGEGRDSLFGEGGADWLDGGAGNDALSGGAGNDSISGGEGRDTLGGSTGRDTLDGGPGADLYSLAAPNQGPDEIVFTPGEDRFGIDASAFGGGLSAGAMPDARVVANGAGTPTGAFGQFLHETSAGRLWWDADGTGAGARVLVALVQTGGGTLSAADFTIVA